jgi:chemotaxis protein methyltransferase CheR
MTRPSAQTSEREFPFTDKDFRFLADLANSKTGIVLNQQKRDMIYSRLVRRLRALKLDSFAQYCELMQSPKGADEMTHLVNAVTTNLTSFFRESHHFDHLRDHVLKPLVAARGDKHVRLWSAACSSGMEPYSMAMTMRAALPNVDSWNAKILATDIDTNMVNTGAAGQYNTTDVEEVPAMCRSYIDQGPKPGTVMMGDEIKKLITFRQLNLLENWPMKGQFDAVFCRNVVIYFDKPTKQVLFERMAEYIKPNGFLYIGHSENLHGVSDRFELIGRTIYRRVR